MNAVDPQLAARVAAKGVPLSADWARLSPAREQQIRTLEPAPPGLRGLGLAGSESEQRLYGRAAELHQACGQLLAEIDRLRDELVAAREGLETVRALCDAADYAGITSGGWFTVEAVRKATKAGESR
jgi:hypothetical protein